MYICVICCDVVQPRQSMLKHILYRANKQIEREVPVCGGCHGDLARGVLFDELWRALHPRGGERHAIPSLVNQPVIRVEKVCAAKAAPGATRSTPRNTSRATTCASRKNTPPPPLRNGSKKP